MHGSPSKTQRERDIEQAGEQPNAATRNAEKNDKEKLEAQDTEVNRNGAPQGGPRPGGVHTPEK